MRMRQFIWWLVMCFLWLTLVALGSWFWLAWNNTLANSKIDWVVSKRNLTMITMGTQSFFFERQALADGRLNLGAWHGFQEVVLGEQLDYRTLKIYFDLEPQGYGYFLFNCQAEYCDALRLSSSNVPSNALVKISPKGEFLNQDILPATALKLKNNELILTISAKRSDLAIFLNGVYIHNFKTNELDSPRKIGFRGGYVPFEIDQVEATGWQGENILLEKFDNQAGWPEIFFKLAVLGLAVLSVVIGLSRSFFKFEIDKVTRILTLGLIGLILGLGALIITDLYLAPRYPQVQSWLSSLNEQEAVYINNESLLASEALSKKHAFEPEENVFRVMVLGTSQTTGAGAAEIEDLLVTQLENLANTKLKNKYRQFEFLQAAVSGSVSTELVYLYETQWYKFKPKLILVNLSSNDSSNSMEFSQQLERLVLTAAKEDIKLIFILEPNSLEFRSAMSTHQIMRDVASRHQLQVVDLHSYLAEKTDLGIIWWDSVHATSFGQKLMAEYIYDQIKSELIAK